jgi:hypothetical protein
MRVIEGKIRMRVIEGKIRMRVKKVEKKEVK